MNQADISIDNLKVLAHKLVEITACLQGQRFADYRFSSVRDQKTTLQNLKLKIGYTIDDLLRQVER